MDKISAYGRNVQVSSYQTAAEGVRPSSETIHVSSSVSSTRCFQEAKMIQGLNDIGKKLCYKMYTPAIFIFFPDHFHYKCLLLFKNVNLILSTHRQESEATCLFFHCTNKLVACNGTTYSLCY